MQWVLSLCAWLISLSAVVSSYIYSAANGRISLFFVAEQYSLMYMFYTYFIQSSNGSTLVKLVLCFVIYPMDLNKCVITCIHHYIIMHFHYTKNSLFLQFIFLLLLSHWQEQIFCILAMVFTFSIKSHSWNQMARDFPDGRLLFLVCTYVSSIVCHGFLAYFTLTVDKRHSLGVPQFTH